MRVLFSGVEFFHLVLSQTDFCISADQVLKQRLLCVSEMIGER